MKLIAIAAILALAGCVHQEKAPDWHWEKQGGTQQGFNQDAGQCDAQAFGVAGGNLLQIALVYDGCMRGKGWYKVASK